VPHLQREPTPGPRTCAPEGHRALESTGEHWRALESTGEHWRALESTGEHWRALESTGEQGVVPQGACPRGARLFREACGGQCDGEGRVLGDVRASGGMWEIWGDRICPCRTKCEARPEDWTAWSEAMEPSTASQAASERP